MTTSPLATKAAKTFLGVLLLASIAIPANARAAEMADRGFTALKFDLDLPLLPGEDLYARTISPAQMDRQVALAEATVAAVAGRADVAFDLHWRYAPADALRLARSLEHLPLLWLEDPTPPQDLASVARIAERTTTPICTGENLYRVDGFVALMEQGGVDILAPDIQKVGGLADTRRIAALGDVHSRPLAPHNIAGPIGTLASAHVCASIPNFLALEWHAASVPFFDELVTLDRPLIADGYVTLPDGPGIGAELDLEVARRYARPGASFFGELPA